MKNKASIFSLLILIFVIHAKGQTSADFVTQGCGFLAVSNITSVNQSFSNAVKLAPNDPAANVFYGITRLLALPSQPAASNFLTLLGVPTAGRNIYRWTAAPQKDAQGHPLAPEGINVTNATSLLRTNILAEVIGAEANLSVVTDTNFTLALTAQDTGLASVTLDYGDLQLMRAMLDGAQYAIYNTDDRNLDIQLSIISSLFSNDKSNGFSVETFLETYPGLLAFAATNDLLSSKTAFLNGANRYALASDIIRNRPTGTVRLFNFDPGETRTEKYFRLTLADLAASLTNGPMTVEVNTNYVVNLSPTFSSSYSPQTFLPRTYKNGFVLWSLPDLTFGGVISGISQDYVEKELEQHLTPIPGISPAASTEEKLSLAVMPGRAYLVQSSTDLLDWTNINAFYAFTNNYSFANPAGQNNAHRFYRIVDAHSNFPPPPNDNFADRIPLTGLGFHATGYTIGATAEASDPGGPTPSIWWTWTAPISGLVVATTAGSSGFTLPRVYVGDSLADLTYPQLATLNRGFDDSYRGFPFYAVAGTVYQVEVSASGVYSPFLTGGVQLTITTPPTLTVTSPTNGATFPSASGFTIAASASDNYGAIDHIDYSVEGGPFFLFASGSVKGPSLSLSLTNVLPTSYVVSVMAVNSFGIPFTTQNIITITP